MSRSLNVQVEKRNENGKWEFLGGFVDSDGEINNNPLGFSHHLFSNIISLEDTYIIPEKIILDDYPRGFPSDMSEDAKKFFNDFTISGYEAMRSSMTYFTACELKKVLDNMYVEIESFDNHDTIEPLFIKIVSEILFIKQLIFRSEVVTLDDVRAIFLRT